MKHQFSSTTGRILTILFIALSVFTTTAQAQTVIGRQNVDQYPCTAWGTMTYGLTYLPSDYATNSNKYPLIIFLHGIGETGDGVGGLYKLLTHGIPNKINAGWDPQAVNPVDGQTYKFIVVSPQASTATAWSYSWPQLQYILADVMNRYRVDPSRIYITGLSAGGNGAWSCLTSGPAASQKFAAAAIASSAPAPLDSIPFLGTRDNVKLWQACGTSDAFYTFVSGSTAAYNSSNPAVPAVLTPFNGLGHSSTVWNTFYEPTWRSNALNKNVYEWMLQYKRGTTTTIVAPVNQAPVANAGTAQTITLPVSAVTLTGTGTDADGSIASYSWSKIAGGAAIISSPSSASTLITGLAQGSYTFRLTVTDNQGSTATSDVVITVNAATIITTSPSSTTFKIEAENWSNMYGVQTESTFDAGGGLNVGWIDNGDWMDYSINPSTTGSYKINFRIATASAGAQLQIKNAAGTVIGTVNVPNTGWWQTWQTVSATVTLNAGQQALRIFSSGSATWNINWLDFAIVTNSPIVTTPAATSFRVEAENWANMSGVQTENTGDAGGGLNVGWIDNGDWMDYSINPSAAGSYVLNLRLASANVGGKLEVRAADGSVLATVTVPNTGWWQTWQTVASTITLPAGQQTIRIVSTGSGTWNINWLDFAPAPVVTAATSFRVEAENFSSMNGVQTENTWDAGGGLNVGWIDNGDWMDYSINPSAAGSYTVNIRIATAVAGNSLEIRQSNGTVLATVAIPNTGWWQTWQTVSTTLNLAAGQQTIRVVSTGSGTWNINWLDFAPATGARTAAVKNAEVVSTNVSMDLFPNPVQSRFALQVENSYTGKLQVDIYNAGGVKVKSVTLSKATQGAAQFYLSASDLPAGQYILKASMSNWSDSKSLIKQ